MEILGDRARPLPAPPAIAWRSLTEFDRPGERAWLRLLEDEVRPTIVRAEEPHLVVWSSLWPSRPHDLVELQLSPHRDGGTLLRFVLSTPDPPPDSSRLGHLRRRLNHLLFADLRFSYGQ